MRWAGWWAGLFCAIACGGSTPTGTSDSGVGSITAPDAGIPDAGTPADCLGLLPGPLGAAVAFDVPVPGATCGPSTVDGQGVTACQAQSTSQLQWLEFGTNGTRQGTFTGPPQVYAQPMGFIGIYGGSPLLVAYWGQGGSMDLSPDVAGDALALGPTLGPGVIAVASSAGSLTVHKLDDQAIDVTNASYPISATPLGAAEDASGSILVLTRNGAGVSGMWVDLTKKSNGQAFALGTAAAVAARPLLGGNVAVQLDGVWTGVLAPGETALRPAPSWLGGDVDFVPVRGGKAYAVVPRSGSAVGIVSAQGSSCGSVSFPGVNAVSVGQEGSAIGSTGASGCTKFVWRNALR